MTGTVIIWEDVDTFFRFERAEIRRVETDGYKIHVVTTGLGLVSLDIDLHMSSLSREQMAGVARQIIEDLTTLEETLPIVVWTFSWNESDDGGTWTRTLEPS